MAEERKDSLTQEEKEQALKEGKPVVVTSPKGAFKVADGRTAVVVRK